MNATDHDGPADERCDECGRLDPAACPCPPERREITRRYSLRLAADVLERSDWLLVDLLADDGDDHASENAAEVVRILREEARAERSREELEEALRAMSDAFLTMADLYIAVTSTKKDRVAAALKADRAARPTREAGE